jgi:hypothetical protein
LDQFQKVITSDNKPYGLHRARDERFFLGEKIFSLRKCKKPTFTFTDFDCYVSQTYFVIKTSRINQKYLTALLNSRLIYFWLKHKGKMQGDLFQIDKKPLMNIPIYKADKMEILSFLLDLLLFLQNGNGVIIKIIDAIVFNYYFPDHMKTNNIDVIDYIEQDLQKVLKGRNFEDLSDSDKQAVITQLQKEWTDPNNEVVKRMAQFKTKSPDILKPILES